MEELAPHFHRTTKRWYFSRSGTCMVSILN